MEQSRGLYLSVSAAVLVVLALLAVVLIFGVKPYSEKATDTPISGTESVSDALVDLGDVKIPDSYEDLYQLIYKSNNAMVNTYAMGAGVQRETSEAKEAAPMAAADSGEVAQDVATEALGAGEGYSEDYSGTNVQVSGIDEGDIVKTDGAYIYAISQGQFVIFKAAGAATEEVSRIQVAASEEDGSYYCYPQELYIDGTTAVLVLNTTSSSNTARGFYDYQSGTQTLCFDIADPASVKQVGDFYQSGYYSSSRLNNHVLYVISNYGVYDTIREDEPATFVPLIGAGGVNKPMNREDLRIMPVVVTTNYVVITSLDLVYHARLDQKSILGSSDTVYMSYENLYIASTVADSQSKPPYKESVYTIEEHTENQLTQLVRIALGDGHFEVAAQGSVKGALLNQFSLDEYEGNLRLVVTCYSFSYRIFRDDAYDIEEIKYDDDSSQTNAVYVLDPALKVLGSIEGLAQEERIYSARFSGPVGYMVTFRQIDPLFALDLRDPRNPVVTSELKIPGFSTYLHPFGTGLLLGLGYDVEENHTSGMKLSMFDTLDPFAITEIHTGLVDLDYSEALYNHKAVLVSVERNIIGFPGEQYGAFKEYLVYSFDADKGFELRGKLQLGLGDDSSLAMYSYSYETRGLYIGNYLYVFSGDFLDVFDLGNLDKVLTLKIQASEDLGYGYPMPLMAVE